MSPVELMSNTTKRALLVGALIAATMILVPLPSGAHQPCNVPGNPPNQGTDSLPDITPDSIIAWKFTDPNGVQKTRVTATMDNPGDVACAGVMPDPVGKYSNYLTISKYDPNLGIKVASTGANAWLPGLVHQENENPMPTVAYDFLNWGWTCYDIYADKNVAALPNPQVGYAPKTEHNEENQYLNNNLILAQPPAGGSTTTARWPVHNPLAGPLLYSFTDDAPDGWDVNYVGGSSFPIDGLGFHLLEVEVTAPNPPGPLPTITFTGTTPGPILDHSILQFES